MTLKKASYALNSKDIAKKVVESGGKWGRIT